MFHQEAPNTHTKGRGGCPGNLEDRRATNDVSYLGKRCRQKLMEYDGVCVPQRGCWSAMAFSLNELVHPGNLSHFT